MNGVNNNGNILKVLIQGGLVSIALVCLAMYWNTVNNHIQRNTDAWIANIQASTELRATISDLDKTIKETNDKQVQSFEQFKNSLIQLIGVK
ncbi:hypothetical protein HQ584_00975 [Patescibacteria group bacterium]|nr:hypothetical protein [Patescibacteria group bacterium]